MNRRRLLDSVARSVAVARFAPSFFSASTLDRNLARTAEPDVDPKPATNALWIWAPQEAGVLVAAQLDQHVYFRRSFVLQDANGNATIKISAERLYQLWVNGVFIGEGPALVHPKLKSYDEYPVRKHLKRGKNVVAFRGYFMDIRSPYR